MRAAFDRALLALIVQGQLDRSIDLANGEIILREIRSNQKEMRSVLFAHLVGLGNASRVLVYAAVEKD